MRILAIRGRNLASLAGDFEVDFQQPPLSGAGVFAISGPTGAGKSTLLDTLCLALYHNTPRLLAARESGITIPDVTDRTLTPQDPRNLLRRGCAEGYAEVDFIGVDHHPRRARWQVRRARGKPNGALQGASVSLMRIDTGALEASATRETSEALEKCIGLTFDQFRRAVLLAQNDFATLLKAGQSERADLLEALTNTGDFSLLSIAAHQRNAREQKQLDELKQQLNVLAVLPMEEREKLDADIVTSEGECRALDKTLEVLRAEAQWHARGQRLTQDLEAAELARTRWQQALEADRPQQRQLQQWNSIIPLRPQWHNYGEATKRIAVLQSALPEMDVAIEAAGKQQTAAEAAFHQADHALKQATQNRVAAEPLLAAARVADNAIQQQRVALEGREQQLQAANTERSETAAARDRNVEEQRQLQTTLNAWRAWLNAHPVFTSHEDDWSALGETLRDAHKHLTQLSQNLAEAHALKTQQTVSQTILEQAEQEWHEARNALLGAQTRQQACEQAWRILEPAKLLDAKDAHQTRRSLVNEASVTLRRWIEVQTQQRDAGYKITQLQQQGIEQDETLDAATLTMAYTETNAVAARTAFDRANLAADQITQRLRDALQPGEPCLVCGATAHPQAHAAPSTTDQLLAALKEQQIVADTARDHARQEHTRLQTERKARGSVLGETKTLLQKIDEQIGVIRVSCESIAGRIGADTAKAATQGTEALSAALREIQISLDTQADHLTGQQQQVDNAVQARESASKLVDQRRKKSDDATEKRDNAKTKLAPLEADCHATQRLIGQREQSLQDAIHTLRQQCHSPLLQADQLAGLLQDWNAGNIVRIAADRVREPLASCTATIHTEQQRLTALATQINTITVACEADKEALRRAREHRREVLVHPDVVAHARELEKAASDCRTFYEQQRKSLEDAIRKREEARRIRQQADTDLNRLKEQREGYQRQLLEQLKQRTDILELTAPSLDELAQLIASLPADLSARTAAWAAREKDLADAKARCHTLDDQREAWQLEAGSQRDVEAANAELSDGESRYKAALATQAELQARQKEDQRRHAQAAEHREHIEALTQQARRWQQLNELIGSANGGKFKTYAQQFTLDVLLDYANQHLARLSTRYRLRRGNEPLSLLMIDADFADEVRSVHSLSGGESFLVSLALALGLASLSSERVRVESLFIDEGFGSLDADTLNMAMEALDRLQSEGRRVGVISHVHDMAERIGVQIKVRQVAPGRSVVETTG